MSEFWNNLTRRNPLLPAILLIGLVFGLLFLAFGVARTALPDTTPLPTRRGPSPTFLPSSTASGTPTPTETHTPRPTITLRPTETPTVTPTPTATATETPQPTLTPARPLRFNDLYQLAEWSAADAQRAVELVRSYPNARFTSPEDRTNPEYGAYFRYPVYAYREALLRFASEPAADSFRWGLANALAHMNDPQAVDVYASLISEALNEDRFRLEGLGSWFESNEPRFTLATTSLEPPETYVSSHLVEIKSEGGAYLWLLEGDSGFQVLPLESRFDFANQSETNFTLGDITGDERAELVIYSSPPPEDFTISLPTVYDLSTVPPTRLAFTPEIPFEVGAEYTGSWEIGEQAAPGELRFNALVLPACPVTIRRTYDWRDSRLTLVDTAFEVQPDPQHLEYCELIPDQLGLAWGPAATARLMETILPDWPPAVDLDGKPLPPEAGDEWRYRLALNYALSGDQARAMRLMEEISEAPAVANSPWVQAAQEFLDSLTKPQDLYRLCAASAACDPRAALRLLVSQAPDVDTPPIEALRQAGVTLRSSGVFDFDGDGEPERWLLVRPTPQQKLELWILARQSGGYKALFVDIVDTDQIELRYYEPVQDPLIVQWRSKEGFIMERLPAARGSEPYLRRATVEFIPTTFTIDNLEQALQDLFSGEDPGEVSRRLENVEKSERFNCRNYQVCDRFYYTLGLAYELSGQASQAIDTYVKLWWENSASPLTAMARLKLQQVPTRTPAPTTTRTPTLTPTHDPNASPTSVPTRTPTPDPNATLAPSPTLTPSAALGPTPYP